MESSSLFLSNELSTGDSGKDWESFLSESRSDSSNGLADPDTELAPAPDPDLDLKPDIALYKLCANFCHLENFKNAF
jgi:hypothetical protein